jgi:diguanylate cyclase (GGDEF)-like protein
VDRIESVELPVDILVDFCNVSFIVFLGFSAAVGLLALASPRAFAAVASYGNRTILRGGHTSVDKNWVDIDTFVLGHGRLFGLLVIAMAGYLWLISHHGPKAYSRSFLLIIVAVALSMGIVALRHIMRQSREIELHLAEARADVLTGLANRRAFDVELSRRLAQRQRQGTPLSLLIIDVDNFKSFNDEFGHPLGDAVLKRLASVLQARARHMDIVARLGGDEFAVLIPGSDLEEASLAAERLRSAIADSPLRCDGQEHTLTVSIGLAEARPDDDLASLVKRSDSALYAAKEAGRNCSFRQGDPEPAVPAPCK